MSSDIRDSDINILRRSAMRILKRETLGDETVSVDRHTLFERACAEAGSSGGMGQYTSTNRTLENLVIQDIIGRGDAIVGHSPDQINITYRGKKNPEYN